MKWDYNTYLDQPTWFIDGLLTKMSLEAEEKRRQDKKFKSKNARH